MVGRALVRDGLRLIFETGQVYVLEKALHSVFEKQQGWLPQLALCWAVETEQELAPESLQCVEPRELHWGVCSGGEANLVGWAVAYPYCDGVLMAVVDCGP